MAVATLGLLAATAVTSPAPGRADTNYPVLLVHSGTGNPGNFKEMEQRLAADGYRPFTVNLGFPGVDTARNADVISAEVDKILAATGASKVHLVGHSMGGGRTQLDLPDRMDQFARRVEQPTELVIRWTVERAPVIRGAGRNSRPRRMDLPFAATAVARSILSSPETAPVSPGWSG